MSKMDEIRKAAEILGDMVVDEMKAMYLRDPKGFDKTRVWDALVATSYDLPRLANAPEGKKP